MHTLFQRAYRERRRTLVAAALAFMAGYIFYMKYDAVMYGMPLPVFTGLFYAVFIGVAAMVMSVLLPKLRFTVEAIALSRLIFAIFVWQAPELGQQLLDAPLINATIVVGGAYVVNRLMRMNEGTYAALFAWLDDTQGRLQDQMTSSATPAPTPTTLAAEPVAA